MPKFTEEQQLAIDLEGTNILVSAGAGSGKTAVLSERVLRKVREGVKINELEAQKIEEENQISPWGQYDEERGQALADAANSLNGDKTQGGGWCAAGVSAAIQKAFGYTTSGNGCDYGNVLSQRDDWAEITDSVQTLEDFQNLPAGAIVSWSPYDTTSLGNTYGHVYIADGEGNGISDFKEDITSYYMDRNSEWRVFLPI